MVSQYTPGSPVVEVVSSAGPTVSSPVVPELVPSTVVPPVSVPEVEPSPGVAGPSSGQPARSNDDARHVARRPRRGWLIFKAVP